MSGEDVGAQREAPLRIVQSIEGIAASEAFPDQRYTGFSTDVIAVMAPTPESRRWSERSAKRAAHPSRDL